MLDAHFQVAAELDVRAAARHVRGDGDGAGHTGLGHNKRFLLMVAGVQHRKELFFFRALVAIHQRLEGVGIGKIHLPEAALFQKGRELLALFDRGRTTRTGCPRSFARSISAAIASSFSAAVR